MFGSLLTRSGKPDMNIDGVWARRGMRVNCVDDYHL